MREYYSFTTEYGMADELFRAVLSLDKQRVELLKEKGVTLTENVKQTLVNGGGSMVSNKPNTRFWYFYLSDLENVGKEDFVYISRTFFEEIGEPLYYSDSLVQVIGKYFYNTAVFMCLMECYDQKKLNKKKTLEALVRKNRVDLLEVCVKSGWLKQAKKRDELIEYANAQNKPECTAYLLEFKNNTADLKAERAKAEKKAERELNAAPDSALELGKLWSWKKQENGELIITSYKGEETEVTIPAKIGNNIVTAVGDYALSSAASRANNKTSRLMIEKIIVPNGIRTIGESALGGAGMWGKGCRLKEVVLPETLDIFTDRQAAETAPNIADIYTEAIAVIPRMENAVFYCTKHNMKYRFAADEEIHIPYKEVIASDALYAAILAVDREKVGELKKGGAVLTDYIKKCLLSEQHHGTVLYDVQKEFLDFIFKTETGNRELFFKTETGNREFILSSLKAETGEPLYFGQYKYYKYSAPELFDCILEYYDTKFLNKTLEMQRFINNEKTEHIAICAKHGWLKNSATRDKMIKFASDNGKTESAAWLLDFKNRTADFAAEQAKAEKKMLAELNASPTSVTALKKIWSYKKREDGTLVITSYKGTSTEVTVPEKIGKSAVTAIGKGAFADMTALVEINIPEGIAEIGEVAFYQCVSLQRIVIPRTVKQIGKYAFRECDKLTAVVEKGSYVEEYCKSNGVPYAYKENK